MDPMLQDIALSPSLLQHGANCLITVNHPLTQEGHQRKAETLHHAEYSLYANTQLTKTKRAGRRAGGRPPYFESICNSKHSLGLLALVELVSVGSLYFENRMDVSVPSDATAWPKSCGLSMIPDTLSSLKC